MELTAKETSDRLNVSLTRVYQLIRDGRLISRRFAGVHLIDSRSVEKFKPNDVGRPRKRKNR